MVTTLVSVRGVCLQCNSKRSLSGTLCAGIAFGYQPRIRDSRFSDSTNLECYPNETHGAHNSSHGSVRQVCTKSVSQSTEQARGVFSNMLDLTF